MPAHSVFTQDTQFYISLLIICKYYIQLQIAKEYTELSQDLGISREMGFLEYIWCLFYRQVSK